MLKQRDIKTNNVARLKIGNDDARNQHDRKQRRKRDDISKVQVESSVEQLAERQRTKVERRRRLSLGVYRRHEPLNVTFYTEV